MITPFRFCAVAFAASCFMLRRLSSTFAQNTKRNERADTASDKMPNKKMDAKKCYDHKFVIGTGAHSDKHESALFPDVMRWMWRDWKKG